MNFQLTDEQLQIQDAARRFAQQEMPPVAKVIEETDNPLPDEWRRKYGELGYLGMNIPEKYGGVGAGKLDALLVLEEFAKISAATAFPIFEAAGGPAQTILHHGPEWLKEQVLPKVASGEMLVAVSMTEPSAGTAMTDLTTRAEIKGNKIIINGVKRWCSGAGHSQGYVLYCRLEDKPGAAGIGAVYFEKDYPGVSFGKPEEFMGVRGFHNAEIYLDNVEVPIDNIVVPTGKFPQLMKSFNMERLGNSTCCVGLASSALDYVTGYVQERKQFGKELCEFQAVQMRLAEMVTDVDIARLLVHRAAVAAGDGLPPIKETSVAKYFCNEAVRRVTTNAMQLMGAYGYSRAYPIEQKVRDCWVWGIGGGGIDLQKINIASDLIGRRFSQRAQ